MTGMLVKSDSVLAPPRAGASASLLTCSPYTPATQNDQFGGREGGTAGAAFSSRAIRRAHLVSRFRTCPSGRLMVPASPPKIQSRANMACLVRK